MINQEIMKRLKINKYFYICNYDKKTDELMKSDLNLGILRNTSLGKKADENAFDVLISNALNWNRKSFVSGHELLAPEDILLEFWDKVSLLARKREDSFWENEERIQKVKGSTAIGGKVDPADLKRLIHDAFVWGVQAQFLDSQKDSGFTEEELDEFFWVVWKIQSPVYASQISKAMAETWMVKNLTIFETSWHITRASREEVDVFEKEYLAPTFRENFDKLGAETKRHFYSLVRSGS